MTPGTPRNGAVTVLRGKTTENNGKRPTKGFLKTNGSKERRGERTDIEYHCYGTCIIGLHTGCSDPRNRMTYCVDCPRAKRSNTLVLCISIFADLSSNFDSYWTFRWKGHFDWTFLLTLLDLPY